MPQHDIAIPPVDSDDDSNVWFSPTPGTYVVIRINAVEMVRHFKDGDALEAARQMQTKCYLVCLERVCGDPVGQLASFSY